MASCNADAPCESSNCNSPRVSEPRCTPRSAARRNRVFAPGAARLADLTKYTNNVSELTVGFNWYLNKSVKIYFDWEHAIFGNPVVYNTNTGRKSSISDLYWLRFQFYF